MPALMPATTAPRRPAPAAATAPSAESPRRLANARRMARVLDDRYVDPILGFLLPGVGDAVSSLFGLYLVGLAVRSDMPLTVVARMLINLAVDTVFGLVPIVGDLFDLAFKANSRNLALLEARTATRRATVGDRLFVGVALLLALAALALPLYLVFRLLAWIA